MHVSFIGQPFSRQSIGNALIAEFANPKNRRFTGLVAWAKASGLGRIVHDVQAFRDATRGNSAELLIGIDEGGATFEGLELARTTFNKAYVFHDRGSRTFHTKIYLFEGKESATLIVGSGNFTKGGLWTNYEAANLVKLDLTDKDDIAYLESVREYIQNFKNARDCCIQLTAKSMALLKAGDYNIKSEAEMNKQRASTDKAKGKGGLFTTMKGLGTAPKSVLQPESDDADSDNQFTPTQQSAMAPAVPIQTGTGWNGNGRSFYKKLSTHDASPVQAPGQIVIPIEFKDFFPPLNLQWDKIGNGGSRQSEAKFAAKFRDGSFSKDLAEVRFILYEPATHQARKNPESRFTFHDREVFGRFSAGDVIQFKIENGACVIERHTDGLTRPKKYAWLS